MSHKTRKHFSEAKYSRIDREYCGLSIWHRNAVRRFHRSDRQETKRALKQAAR